MHAHLDYTLAKKTAVAGLRCQKLLWWMIHDAHAEELQPARGDEYRFSEGRRVGEVARQYVPGGVLISGERGDALGRLDATRRAMADAAVPAIYEAAFVADDTLVYADILERRDAGWTLIEVKSGTSVSADEHLPDIAVQGAVLRAAGVRVDRYEIMHLNRECRFPDLSNLFIREDVTDDVLARLDEMDRALVSLVRVARAGSAPAVAIGDQCSKPRDCAFRDRCWPVLPKHHVSTLYMMKRKAKDWVSQGYETIDQLPDDLKLSAIAARQRRAVREGAVVVEREALVKALADVARPVAHLDFETIQPAIPRWPGGRPYDQIPVQLSCHVVTADGTTTHHEWLFDGQGDPRPPAARAILDACAGAKTVTAYYSNFEKQCIELVAEACPGEAPALLEIANKLVDLLPIVRNHVYHPDFGGSFSLKAVLPALVPEMSYAGLVIAEGGTAQAELSRLFFDAGMSEEERREIRDALLRYCKLDTEAMVALERRLLSLV